MKKIKLFESFNFDKHRSFTKELQKFCDDNLAYLIDNGYLFKLFDDNKGFSEFILYKPNGHVYELFEFSDIKYDLIPFLILLNKTYEVTKYKSGYQVKFDNHTTTEPAIYNIDSDEHNVGLCDFDDDFNISKIEFIELRIKQNI